MTRSLGGLTFLYILGVSILLSLGTWQVYRLQWKTNLIEELTAVQNAPPLSLRDGLRKSLSLKDKVSQVPVRVVGVFCPFPSFYVKPRTHKGQAGGHSLAVFQEAETGLFLLVNRGWVPQENIKEVGLLPHQKVTLEGFLMPPPAPGWFTPVNQVESHDWYQVDLQQMGQALGITLGSRYLLLRGKSSFDNQGVPLFPRPVDMVSSVRNNHLSYAITWYSFALILSLFYAALLWQKRGSCVKEEA